VPNGLNFMFPPGGKTPVLPPMISFDLSILFQVKGVSNPIAMARIAGNRVAIDAKTNQLASAVLILDPENSKKQEKLSLQGLAASSVVYTKPVAAGTFISVKNDFVVHTGKGQQEEISDAPAEPPMLSFTDTFTQ
jgi:hypothetical protein